MKSSGIKDVMTKTKTVAAATTLMAGLGVATNVHADDVTDNTQVQTQASQEAKAVTQADVNTAKETLDTANQAVNAQEQVVKEAATSADSAQEAYNQAQEDTTEAQELVNQATPEAINDAAADVTTAENQVATAESLQEQAESTQAQAQTAVDNQNQVVSQAEAQVTTAQEAVTTAQQDVNNKQAILDGTGQAEAVANRDKAQADVNTAQNQVAQAESDLTKAQEADSNREKTIDKAEQTVQTTTTTVNTAKAALDSATQTATQAQATVNQKTQAVTDAQKDVNNKQAILDGTGQQAILDEAAESKADEAAKKEQLAAAQSALKQAQEADVNRQQAIDKAQKAVDDANQAVKSTKVDLEAKTATASQVQADLAKTQAAFKTAENDYNSINTITLTQDYIRLLKQSYTANTLQERKQALEELKARNDELKPNYEFKANPNDDKHIVDLNNLSLNQLTELSLFASDLVNQIRQQVGSASTVVTDSSVGFAKKVTENYILDNWDIAKGHDAFAVNNAAKYYGLSTSSEEWEKAGLQFYENLSGLLRNSQSTMSDLKEDIYDSIYRFMFEGDEYDHASSIAGIRANNATTVSYLGVGFTSLKNGYFDGAHFLLVGDNYVKNVQNNNFSTTVIENLKTPEKVTTTYNTAKADLEAKTATNNSLQSALSTAQNNYNNAVAINTKAQQALDEAQSIPAQTPSATANLGQAQTAYDLAVTRLTKANEAVANLTADVKAKQEALAIAKEALSKAQADLAKATAINTAAQAKKATAQSAYDQAVSQLAIASDALTSVKAVPVQTPQATSHLTKAQDNLVLAQERLTNAQEAVDSLAADIKVKEANLAKAKQVLALKEAELTAKQDVLAKAKARLASLQADLTKAQANVTAAKANVDQAKATLSEAKATLANLKNAPQLLKDAQSREATAKANLLKALDMLEAELFTLKGLQAQQAVAQVAYETTSKAYQAVLDAKEQARLKAEYDHLLAQGKQPIPVVDETGKIIGYTVLTPVANQLPTTPAGKQTAVPSQTATPTATQMANTPTKPTTTSLPTTGDTTSTVAILFGSLLTLFGLVGVRRKETK
ncbi:TPA: SEC10/PgrA surface exclusion domain-containing protein [Streptococcus pyogenes]|nr:SEC10/PgrA surface exclusion domain-containing protein [Streptococcus pyogenes]